jgi:hypothetical protein
MTNRRDLDRRRAMKKTLKIVSGVSTSRTAGKFFSGKRFEDLKNPEALIRMKNREPKTQDEQALIILSVAMATGDLKKICATRWMFRGYGFYSINQRTIFAIYSKFTDTEIYENKIDRLF